MTATASLGKLLAGIVEVPASIDKAVSDVCLDSRYCSPGSLFLACDGIASHGLDYLDQAIRLGAKTVLWEPTTRLPESPDFEGIDALAVPRLSQHVGRIAARFHGDPTASMAVVGVTGTNGKTSVAHLTARAAEGLGKPAALFGTLGYGMLGKLEAASHTTPDAVRLQQSMAAVSAAGAELVAMEVSSHALDQHRADGVHFHTAIFTNLTHEHLDYHGDLGRYAEAKRRLFEWPGLKAAVINVDDQTGRDFLRSLDGKVASYAFAIDQETLESIEADHRLHAASIRYSAEGLGFDLVLDGETCCTVHCDLLGRFNVSNLLATAAALHSVGFSLQQICKALCEAQPVRGRMQRLGGDDRPMVIVDYAHTPDAILQVLSAAREHTTGRLICVFGCGGDRDKAKRPEMGRIAERLADRIIITDDNPRTEDGNDIVRDIRGGLVAPDEAVVERGRRSAIRLAIIEAKPGDTVVVAGKGHEDYQIIGSEREYFSDAETVRAVLQEVHG